MAHKHTHNMSRFIHFNFDIYLVGKYLMCNSMWLIVLKLIVFYIKKKKKLVDICDTHELASSKYWVEKNCYKRQSMHNHRNTIHE